jgi:hypothetical protein
MRRFILVTVCFVMLGVSLALGSGIASANGGGTMTTMSGPGWCRNC